MRVGVKGEEFTNTSCGVGRQRLDVTALFGDC